MNIIGLKPRIHVSTNHPRLKPRVIEKKERKPKAYWEMNQSLTPGFILGDTGGLIKNYTLKKMKISILGCGWLGKPLAHFLMDKGFSVKGSTSSNEKVAQLQNEGIEAYKVACTEKGVQFDKPAFFNADVLVVNIPPRRASGFNYPLSMGHLADLVAKANIKKVIFVSATSVYPENGKLVMEDDASPENERSKTLLDAEGHFLSKPAFKTTILRMSGLIGPGRVPGVTKRKVNLSDGPVNLIHLDDCISIIHEVIKKDPTGKVYNASSPEQPLRSELYRHVRDLGFHSIEISKETDNNRKRVSSQKLISNLAYTFKYKNPLKIGLDGYVSSE